MNRETKEIITPLDKQKVKINAWLTGREKRDLRDVLLEGIKFSMKQGEAKTESVNTAELVKKTENKAIEIVVVSIDGSEDKVLERLLDMKSQDYDFVISEVNEISKEVDFTKPEKEQ